MSAENLCQSKREQVIRDGYCLIEGVLSMDLIDGLREGSDRLLDQFSPEEQHRVRYQGSNLSIDFQHPSFAELVTSPALLDGLAKLGWPAPRYMSGYILSKPPGGPPLYWHQDWGGWDDPISYEAEPMQIFAMIYLTDTVVHNGCLRVIPGSHRLRNDLHEQLTEAHSPATYDAELTETSPMFRRRSDEVDVPVKVGDLVIGDARVLHAAHANNSDQRRTCMTLWYFTRWDQCSEGLQSLFKWTSKLPADMDEDQRSRVESILTRYEGSAEPLAFNRHQPDAWGKAG